LFLLLLADLLGLELALGLLSLLFFRLYFQLASVFLFLVLLLSHVLFAFGFLSRCELRLLLFLSGQSPLFLLQLCLLLRS
jgi:hypothetical protein